MQATLSAEHSIEKVRLKLPKQEEVFLKRNLINNVHSVEGIFIGTSRQWKDLIPLFTRQEWNSLYGKQYGGNGSIIRSNGGWLWVDCGCISTLWWP